MSVQNIEMKCPVCQHKLPSVLDEKALAAMAIYCPNCNVKITLTGTNTTAGLAITGYIPNEVINEHIAKMKDKDWKKKKGFQNRRC